MKNLIQAEDCYELVGACCEVYKKKGCGFLESVFQECLALELDLRGIPFDALNVLRLEYKGRPLKQGYAADFVCFDRVIIELKAVSKLADEHRAQVLNYLNATGLRLGLLVNLDIIPSWNGSASSAHSFV